MKRKCVVLIVCCLVACGGCADLSVRKVSLSRRLTGRDHHIKGFRYYLARPYVVVKEWVPVSENVTLLVADSEEARQILGNLAASQGATPQMARFNAASGSVEPVSQAEWAVLKQQLLEGARLQPAAFCQGRTPPVEIHNHPVLEAPSLMAMAPGLTNGAPLRDGFDAADASGDAANGAFKLAAATDQSARDNRTGPGLLGDSTAPKDATDTAPLVGPIDVVFLPDLDEQYAVHNRNFLGQSSYELNFKDGWQLLGVGGEFDSTTVAIEILKTVDAAIDAAKTVQSAGITAAAKRLAAADTAFLALPDQPVPSRRMLLEVVTTTYLKPGFYRINKPWEVGPGEECVGCGLLAKLGLETVTVATVRPATPQPVPSSFTNLVSTP